MGKSVVQNLAAGLRLWLTVAVIGAATPVAAEVLRPQARPEAMLAAASVVEAAPDETAQPAPSGPAPAEPETAPPEPGDPAEIVLQPPSIGPETNLPLPRYVSLKSDEGNVRRGPSLSHRIDWVFTRREMPLQIVAEYGNWRRIVDREGIGGWVHYSLLSGNRTVLVEEDMLPIRTRPSQDAPVAALFEAGVIARLGDCTPAWCRISAGGYRGWAEKSGLWGVDPDEIRD